jgi:uncharacterized Fe-S cluster-containing radical SAM superfamily protein
MVMKVLYLGNNTTDTDTKAKRLALGKQEICHGLLSELDGVMPVTLHDGCYHSSVYDIAYGHLVDLASKFDWVIMLDQPKEQYSHPDAFYKTVKLIKQIPNGQFLDASYATAIRFFEDLVETNKSFCIFPFIELLTNQRDDGYTTVCCRSSKPVSHISKIIDWQSNNNYNAIRDKMLAGILVPDHCSSCYELEEKNILSAREQETVEWANRLNLTSLDDLDSIKYPAYYEIRPSNVCNLQCRMCGPDSSQLIAKEYKRINLIKTLPPTERSNFDIVNFTNLKKLYVAGGEPTAMPEFYDFLDRCIKENKTFEFLVNTNGTKINGRFKKQLKALPHMQFIISIDGVGDLNHYIRWPSDWNAIVDNMKYLVANNHKITTNTTVSIYNVTRLYELFKWFDDEFPGMLVHAQLVGSNNDILSALRFPNTKLALASLLPIQQLKCYNNDKLLKSFVDGLIAHYKSVPIIDQEKLKLFFKFNDKLDKSRGVQLQDYIPELYRERLCPT